MLPMLPSIFADYVLEGIFQHQAHVLRADSRHESMSGLSLSAEHTYAKLSALICGCFNSHMR